MIVRATATGRFAITLREEVVRQSQRALPLSLCSCLTLVLKAALLSAEIFACIATRAADAPRRLSLAEVRSLSAETAASSIPVCIHGVVTRCTHNELYLQDGTDAVFVTPDRTRTPYQPGDAVEIVGVTAGGQFLPIVTENSSNLLAHPGLPPPTRATYGELATGRLDCRWVEITGVVRSSVRSSGGGTTCQLAVDGAILPVEIAGLSDVEARNLVGAVVTLRGVAGGLKNRDRQMIQPGIWIAASSETFRVQTPAPADPFALPSQAIATLMSYSDSARPNPLSKIVGQVTWAETSTRIFIRDNTGNCEVHLQTNVRVQSGDEVEVVGFADRGTIKPMLADAFAHRVGPGQVPQPHRTNVRNLLRGSAEADLVEIQGVLREVARTSQSVTFTVDAEDGVFDAIYSRKADEPLPELPGAGTRAAFIGICRIDRMTSDVQQVASPASFTVRLRTLEDIRVLAAASWWTTRRLTYVVGGLSAVLLLALGWIGSLRKTVARQTRVIVAQTRAEATQEERDRIARELHDSLEQRLAGTTILLDAAASALPQHQEPARKHLDTARAMLRHSLEEAQRSVLDLRSRELDHGDFSDALERSLRSLAADNSVELAFERDGPRLELGALAEHHVLRIAQEAVANALKHAEASKIWVTLSNSDVGVLLRVRDNGRGLCQTRELAEASAGQFGLIGMRERADKLHGSLRITSAHRSGTTIELAFRPRPAGGSVPPFPPRPDSYAHA